VILERDLADRRTRSAEGSLIALGHTGIGIGDYTLSLFLAKKCGLRKVVGREILRAMNGKESSVRTGIFAASLLLAASNLLSRLLGYGREVLLAYFSGVGRETDAYFAAFVVPDLLNYLLAGGALSIAFLPFYSEALRESRKRADDLLGVFLGNLGVIAILSTLLLWRFADPLVALQFPEFEPEARALTVRLTRIVLPAQICFVLGGVIKAGLFARGRFGAAAAAPLLYNLSIIGVGTAFYRSLGIEAFAWGVLLGSIVGPLGAPLVDAIRSGQVGLRVDFGSSPFFRYLLVAAPLMFGQSLLTVDEWFDKWFGALLQEGAVAQLSYARRLMLVPVAVIGQAIATAALPTLTRYWQSGERAKLDRTVLSTLRSAGALASITAVPMIVLAQPIVTLVYERGAWTSGDTVAVSGLLMILGLAVPAWILQQIAVRPFYARGDTWRPMGLGTLIVLLAIPLYLGLSREMGIDGLAWAGVLGMWGNALATLELARRVHGSPNWRELGPSLLRSIALASLVGGAGYGLLEIVDRLTGGIGPFLALAIGGAFLSVVGFGVFVKFGEPELAQQLKVRLLSRIRQK